MCSQIIYFRSAYYSITSVHNKSWLILYCSCRLLPVVVVDSFSQHIDFDVASDVYLEFVINVRFYSVSQFAI